MFLYKVTPYTYNLKYLMSVAFHPKNEMLKKGTWYKRSLRNAINYFMP